MTSLVLHLKREYWEAIRDGSKREEYRLSTPYWVTRLAGRSFSEIVLLCGYPKAGDHTRTIKRKWKGVHKKMIQHDHFGRGLVSVFAIDVSEAQP